MVKNMPHARMQSLYHKLEFNVKVCSTTIHIHFFSKPLALAYFK